jgi:WD40 repeat protein
MSILNAIMMASRRSSGPAPAIGRYGVMYNRTTDNVRLLTWNGSVLAGDSNWSDVIPTTSAGAGQVDFSEDGTVMVAVGGSPYVYPYKIDVTTGAYTALTTSALTGSLPTSNATKVAVSKSGEYFAVAQATNNPRIIIYRRNAGTDTWYSLTATIPSMSINGLCFSPDGTRLFVAGAATPFLLHFSISGDTVTQLSNPASLPDGAVNEVAVNPQGTHVALALGSSLLNWYSYSGSTLTKLTNPTTMPSTNVQGVAWDKTGIYLGVVQTASPYVLVYKRATNTLTKLTDPVALAGSGQGVCFSGTDNLMICNHSTTPFLTAYRRSGDTFTKLSIGMTGLTTTNRGSKFWPRAQDGDWDT